MNKKYKNIPSQFLKNSNLKNDTPDFYITSSDIKTNSKNDTIWLILVFLILLDIL